MDEQVLADADSAALHQSGRATAPRSFLQIVESTLDMTAHGSGWLSSQGVFICPGREVGPIETSEKLGSRDVKLWPVHDLSVATQSVQDLQTCCRPLYHCHSDGAVGANHVRRLEAQQLVVKQYYLRPIRLVCRSRLHVTGCNCSPELIGTWTPSNQGLVDVTQPFLDLPVDPQAPVLILQQYQPAV